MKKDIIIVDNFYSDPYAVREYAMGQLKTNFHSPYQDKYPGWITSNFKKWNNCPFKSSESVIQSLCQITSEEIDLDHWKLNHPMSQITLDTDKTLLQGCRWNFSFHFKKANGVTLGEGVHNHMFDPWNKVGEEGWVGLIYLNPEAPIDSGLYLWKNKDQHKRLDWMGEAENWKLVDTLGAVFNRLILVRGNQSHSGADGFSNLIEEGRLFQTIFFKTKKTKSMDSVNININQNIGFK